jgi:hypothetical protein
MVSDEEDGRAVHDLHPVPGFTRAAAHDFVDDMEDAPRAVGGARVACDANGDGAPADDAHGHDGLDDIDEL